MKKYSGLTLVELLVTLVVAGVLAAVAVPGMRTMLVRRQVQATIDSLQADFRYARVQALKRGHSVTICRSDNGTACHADDGSWQVGWIIFDDLDGNRSVDTGDSVLRVQAAWWGLTGITVNGGAITPMKYEFMPNGVAPGSASNILIEADGRVDGGKRLICVTAQARLGLQPVGTTRCSP